jgi:hypothetical protein
MTSMLLAAIVSDAGTALAAQPAAAAQAGVQVGLLSPAAISSQTAPSHPDRGARPTRTNRSTHASISQGALTAPTTATVPVSTSVGHHSDLQANFDGVGSLDSEITNFGAKFEPPDQGLCAGNGFVVEMVNSAFRVYDTHGHTLAGPTNVNAPFHDGFLQFTSDPRCVYDASTHTWFAIVLFINDSSDGSRLDIAVNTSGDPTTDWTVFNIDTTDATAPSSFGCPCLGDQPTLGIDSSNIYTTTNEFSLAGTQFDGAQIYAISKRDLVHHAKNVHFVHYSNLTIGGAQAASIQPASTFGPAPAEYFLSSLDPVAAGDNRIGVWALTNVGRVTTGGVPKLSSVVISSEAYSVPPPAKQKGLASTLDSGDDRMQATQYINGEIWGALTTTVMPEDDTTPRAGAAWFRVRPHLSGSKLGSASLTGQGYVVAEDQYVIYPAIAVDSEGRAAMVFTLTGANRFASAAYAVLKDERDEFGHPIVAAAGTGPYDPKATRWGDYSWAVLDPRTDSVWMATEYIPPAGSQTTTGRRNWGTRVLNLSLE